MKRLRWTKVHHTYVVSLLWEHLHHSWFYLPFSEPSFSQMEVQIIGASWLNRGVNQGNDLAVALSSENSPVRPGLSALRRWACILTWAFYPCPRKSREAQVDLEHDLSQSVLDCSSSPCQVPRPEARGRKRALCAWVVPSSTSMPGSRCLLLIQTKGWERPGSFTSDEILFLGLFWCD